MRPLTFSFTLSLFALLLALTACGTRNSSPDRVLMKNGAKSGVVMGLGTDYPWASYLELYWVRYDPVQKRVVMAVDSSGKASPDDYVTMLLRGGGFNRQLTTPRYVGASVKPGTWLLAAVRHGNPEAGIYEAAHFAIDCKPAAARHNHWGRTRFLPGSEGWDIANLNGKRALPGAVHITVQQGKMHYIGNAIYLLDKRRPAGPSCPLTAVADGWRWTWGNAEEASRYAGARVEVSRVKGE
jgi:hypothetical protein